MSDDITALGLIHDSQIRMEGKMDKIESCVSSVKVEQGKHSVRIRTLERERAADHSELDEHLDDTKVHYNPDIAKESKMTYVWRNKLKIAIITFLVSLITVGGGILVQWMQAAAGGP